MRKSFVTLCLLLVSIIVMSSPLRAASINNANYGSIVIRDGIFSHYLLTKSIGHAGVVAIALFGHSPNAVHTIIQANGYGTPSSMVSYSTFLGTGNYKGSFRSKSPLWSQAGFRADVVKFANQAKYRNYNLFTLYNYPFLSTHFSNLPYVNVIPTHFRCDGLAEWSVEQAMALRNNPVAAHQSDGFYKSNNPFHQPLEIAQNWFGSGPYGIPDSAFTFTLTVDSSNPGSGIAMTISTTDSKGLKNGSTVVNGGMKRLYSKGTWVTITAPAIAPNGNVFSTWWGCTARNGGKIAARTCTTNMNKDAHYTASYVSPGVMYQAGDRVKVISPTGLNVRSCASTSARCRKIPPGAPAGEVGIIQPGGSSQDSVYTWWKIRWENGVTGYSVQRWFAPVATAGMPTAPTVQTTSATLITSSSAKLNATITSKGGSTILERRFGWNTKPDFSGSGSATNLNGGHITLSGNNFSYLLTGLTSNTTYYFRSWVRNSIGLAPTPLARSFTTRAGSPLVSHYTINVSASPSAGGSVSGSGTSTAGSFYTVTATPNRGYTFTNWVDSGSVVSSSASYAFILNTNRTLVANFTAIPVSHYTIAVSASPSAGGSVSGSGTSTAGSFYTVTATPNRGYTFTNWVDSGSVVSSSASYAFILNTNRTLVANFTAIPVSHYTIKVSASPSAGGSVSGSTYAAVGSHRTVTATPNSGYTFTNWVDGGSVVSSSASYAFILNTNRTLVANFTATTAVIPGAPTIVTATASNTSVSVSFTTPTNTGSSVVTGYRVTSNPAGGVDTDAGTTALTHIITGLTNGTVYTFTVTATNSAGTSPSSAASNSVTLGKASQTISFGTAPAIAVGRTGMVSATSTSGLAVSFSSTTPTICTISGGTITGASVGICTITADQAGNASYNAASRVSQNIRVMAPPVIKSTTGIALTKKQTVAPMGSLTVVPAGGTGRFTASVSNPASAVTNLAANANGDFTFRPPSTGAFAGDYTLTLTDATSGLSTTLAINVPLKVTASRLNILESDHTQTVTVSGGAAYDVFNVVVLNVARPGPNGKPTPDTNVNKIAANILSVKAASDAAKGNPATATIIPANVTTITPFAVQVADSFQPALATAQSSRMHIIAENRVTLTVTDANTYAPIKGARIELRRPDPIIARSNATTTTNAQGVAAPTLPISPLIFNVTATGYLQGTIKLVQGVTTGAVSLRPITSPVNYTGSINAVAPFTLPADTRVTAVDASGHKMFVNTGSTTRFTLPLDANAFIPVQFIATATGAISNVQLAPAGGATVIPDFSLRARPVAVSGAALKTDVVTGKPTANAGEEIFTAGTPAGAASGVTSVEILGKPTASIDKAKPHAIGNVTVTGNQPVIEVLMKRGSIISAPVVYQKLVDANGNKRRKDAGTKPMVVGGVTDTFNIPVLTAVSNVRVYLPINAFKTKNAAGNALAVGQIFTTVSGVASTSTVGRDKAKLTGGDIVEIDMVAFDNAGNVLSTAVGNTNLDQGMEIRIPIDPNALAAAGFDASTANAAFASGKLVINTASTIAGFEAGKVTVVPGQVTYDPLTGEAVFFVKHFSAFGAGVSASVPAPVPTSGAGAVASGSSGGSGGVSLWMLLVALVSMIFLRRHYPQKFGYKL